MRLITLAIHTYDHALRLKAQLQSEGIDVTLQNVNLQNPTIAPGVRVRIHEHDLPLALRIIENPQIFSPQTQTTNHPIIVPVDFAPHTANAIDIAFHLAAYHHTDIHLIHTYLDPDPTNIQLTPTLTLDNTNNDLREKIRNQAQQQLQHLKQTLLTKIKNSQLPPVKITTQVLEGVPEDTITDYARTTPPYLTVMATRSAQQKKQQQIGSVTAEIIDKCAFSVLTVPDGTTPKADPQNINILLNLEDQDILAIDTLARIITTPNPTITLIPAPQRRRSILPDRDHTPQTLQNIITYCQQNHPGYTFTTNTKPTSQAITGTDLLVIPNKKKNSLARLLNPGLAHQILIDSDTPMLVIPI